MLLQIYQITINSRGNFLSEFAAKKIHEQKSKAAITVSYVFETVKIASKTIIMIVRLQIFSKCNLIKDAPLACYK